MIISVLIATCNRADLLKKCLSHLLHNTRLPDEIILIDQSDDNKTEIMLETFKSSSVMIRYEKMDRRGKSIALNRAIELSKGDFLALTDDDVWVDEKWLETFSTLLKKQPDLLVCCGRVLPEHNTDSKDYLNLKQEKENRWIDQKSDIIHLGFIGANVFINRDIAIKVGGFNRHFGPGSIFKNNDDGEFAYRLIRAGYPILYFGELFVYHSGWRNKEDNLKLKYDYTFSLGAFAGFYAKLGDFRPTIALMKKMFLKLRRFFLGFILYQKERIEDGYIHIKGFSLGYAKGFTFYIKKRYEIKNFSSNSKL